MNNKNLIPEYSRCSTTPNQLKVTLQQLKNKEIEVKISKKINKQKQILELQDQLEKKARQKNKQILAKLEKSVQLKKKQLQKVKQKWHHRLEYEHEKTKEHYKNQRKKMLDVWKQSRKNITQAQENRNKKSMTQRNNLVYSRNKSVQATYHPKYPQYEDLQIPKLPNISKSNRNKQKSLNNNKSASIYEKNRSESQINNFNVEDIDVERIDRMANKLTKIQQNRKKRQKIYEEKKKNHLTRIQLMEIRKQQNKNTQQNNNKSHKRAKTLGLQTTKPPISYRIGENNKRQLFKQWQQKNRIKNQQLFYNRLQKGQQYIKSMQQRKQKNKIIKEVQEKSIQKKLYIQRMELAKIEG